MRSRLKGIGSADISASMCRKSVPFRRCSTVLRIGGITIDCAAHSGITCVLEHFCRVERHSTRSERSLGYGTPTFPFLFAAQAHLALIIRGSPDYVNSPFGAPSRSPAAEGWVASTQVAPRQVLQREHGECDKARPWLLLGSVHGGRERGGIASGDAGEGVALEEGGTGVFAHAAD